MGPAYSEVVCAYPHSAVSFQVRVLGRITCCEGEVQHTQKLFVRTLLRRDSYPGEFPSSVFARLPLAQSEQFRLLRPRLDYLGKVPQVARSWRGLRLRLDSGASSGGEFLPLSVWFSFLAWASGFRSVVIPSLGDRSSPPSQPRPSVRLPAVDGWRIRPLPLCILFSGRVALVEVRGVGVALPSSSGLGVLYVV